MAENTRGVEQFILLGADPNVHVEVGIADLFPLFSALSRVPIMEGIKSHGAEPNEALGVVEHTSPKMAALSGN